MIIVWSVGTTWSLQLMIDSATDLTCGGLKWFMTVVFPLLSNPTHRTTACFFLQPSHSVNRSRNPITRSSRPKRWRDNVTLFICLHGDACFRACVFSKRRACVDPVPPSFLAPRSYTPIRLLCRFLSVLGNFLFIHTLALMIWGDFALFSPRSNQKDKPRCLKRWVYRWREFAPADWLVVSLLASVLYNTSLYSNCL